MTTYRNIHGRAIQAITTDPSESVAEGQVWYNTTSDTFKSVLVSEAFSSSSPLTTTREGAGAFGTQTTAVIFGGETPSVSGATEEYNGTGFSAGGTMNTARYRLQGTAGTATAGIVFGGVEPAVSNKTETYNGTAWTTSPYTLNTARWCAGAGTQTSALAFGGGPGYKNNSEEFDGEGWTATPTLNTSRNSLSGAGANAEECLAFGGETSSPPAVATNATESWDGTSWTEVNNLNTARYGGYGAGTQSAAFLAGGIVGPGTMQSAAETWDGTNWTSSPASLATARGRLSVAGSSTAAIAMAGQTPSITTATEEYNKSANVITAGAWASGGNLNTARYSLGGFGATQNTAVAFAGRNTPIYNATEEYNGNTWTTVNNYPQSINDPGSCGVLTAGLGLGGLNPPSIPSFPTTGRVTAEYDGTNWTAGGSYTYDAWGTQCAGTQTATIASGGHNYPMPPGNRNDSAEYNGSTWTAGNNMSQVRAIFSAGGSQTASFACGGRSSPGVEDPTNLCEEYDGTNWTTGGNYIVAVKENTAGGGPQTAGYVAGGSAPTATSITGTYDGTAWSTAANLPGNQQLNGGTSNNTGPSNAMSFGGGTAADATYEFNQESTALNVKTLTQS